METRHFLDILNWTTSVIYYDTTIKTNNVKFALDFTSSFMNKYHPLKEQQPYQINVIDELHINENANSRILGAMLRYKTNDSYEVLKSFLNFISLKFNSQPIFEIDSPTITVEKGRIDLLIRDKGYAIILESKIYNANDQEEQICRYIDLVAEQYNKDNIYIVYLPQNGAKKITNQSWGRYKGEFIDRFATITFQDNIVYWLNQKVLPEVRLKDIYLKSAIIQYVDYLEGYFDIRKINNKMNMELQEFLKKELKFVNNPVSDLNKVNDKINEMNNVINQLEELKKRTSKEVFEAWESQLKIEFPNHDNEMWCYTKDIPHELGVNREYRGCRFLIYIKYNGNNIFYGVSRTDNPKVKADEINEVVLPILNNLTGFTSDNWWYGWKYTSFNNGYQRLVDLIKRVDEEMTKQL